MSQGGSRSAIVFYKEKCYNIEMESETNSLPEHGRRRYSDAHLIAVLRNLHKILERTPTATDVREIPGLPNVATFERRFGSWNEALTAAGIEGSHNRSDETYLSLLADLALRLGRSPTKREVDNEPALPSSGSYRAHFGTFGKAVKQACVLADEKRRARSGVVA